MHAPASVSVEDVIVLLYKQKSPPVPHVLMDPWNETTVAHAREFDVPELDQMFQGFDRVTLPQRLAAILGGDLGGEALNDPVPRPLHPGDALGPPSPDVEEPASTLSGGDAAEDASDAGGGVQDAFDNDENPLMTGGGPNGANLAR